MGKKVKVRVLFPRAFGEWAGRDLGEPEGGSIIDIDEEVAKGLLEDKAAELVDKEK